MNIARYIPILSPLCYPVENSRNRTLLEARITAVVFYLFVGFTASLAVGMSMLFLSTIVVTPALVVLGLDAKLTSIKRRILKKSQSAPKVLEDFETVKSALQPHLEHSQSEEQIEQFASWIITESTRWRALPSKKRTLEFHRAESLPCVFRSVIFDPKLESVIVLLNRKKNMNDELIEEGIAKTVTFAIDVTKNQRYASAGLKYNEEDPGQHERELKGFQLVAGLKGCVPLLSNVSYTDKHGKNKARFFMPYITGGDLLGLLEKTTLSSKQRWDIIEQLLETVVLLHGRKKCIHRDLKPENVLIEQSGDKIKTFLADFGYVCKIDDPVELKMLRGTIEYCPPEYIFEMAKKRGLDQTPPGVVSEKGDVWSLGVLIMVLWMRSPPPWAHEKVIETFRSFHLLLRSPIDIKIYYNNLPIAPLLEKMLVINPEDRVNALNALIEFRKLRYEYDRANRDHSGSSSDS